MIKGLMIFTCPDCGKTLELPKSFTRKRCPDCAKEYTKKMRKLELEEYSEQAQINKAIKAPSHSKIESDSEKEQAQRLKLQHKQCMKCDLAVAHHGFCYCNCLTITGHRVAKGHPPGQCPDFIEKGTIPRETIVKRQQLQLALYEADQAAYRNV